VDIRRIVAFGFVLTVIAAGCATPTSTGPRAASEPRANTAPVRVRAAVQGDPWTLSRTMNGNVGRVRGVNELELLLHSGLSVESDRGVRQAQLAEAMPSLENGLWTVLPDGRMETTWRIRDGAVWHDGTPLTAEDLVFSVRVGQDRETASFRDKGFDALEGVRAVDARTVTVSWSQPYIEADTLFGNQATFATPLPRHILEKPFTEDKAGFNDLPYWTTEFVGTGPFKVREFVRASHVLLDANRAYPLGAPRIDEIEVRFIPDLNTLVANILAGEIDVTIGRALSVENVMQLRGRWNEGQVLVQPGTAWTALYPQHVNPTPPVMADARFRRALMYALDRQELVDTLQHGLTLVAHSIFSPNRQEFGDTEAGVVRYDPDPRRAAQLLEESGYVKAADGLYRDTSGQRLSVEIRSTGGDDFRDKEVLAIADQWQRTGVGVDVTFIPRQRATDREYRVTRPGFEVASQNVDLQNLHTREVPTPETRWVGANRGRYSSPELDALIDRYTTTIPRAERMAALTQIVRHVTDQLVMLNLYYTPDATPIANRLRNVPAGDPWNAHQWEAVGS
jgi:peptide/nickel transport system substrate-binding protein